MNSLTGILIALLVVVWLISRQLQARPVSVGRVPFALIVVGLLQFSSRSDGHPVDALTVGLLGGSLLLGAVMGAWRASTVRVWWQGGQAIRQGNWRTVVLWLLSIGSHLAIAALVHGQAATADRDATLLYLGVTLAAQQIVLLARARSLAAGSTVAGYGAPVPFGSNRT